MTQAKHRDAINKAEGTTPTNDAHNAHQDTI